MGEDKNKARVKDKDEEVELCGKCITYEKIK